MKRRNPYASAAATVTVATLGGTLAAMGVLALVPSDRPPANPAVPSVEVTPSAVPTAIGVSDSARMCPTEDSCVARYDKTHGWTIARVTP